MAHQTLLLSHYLMAHQPLLLLHLSFTGFEKEEGRRAKAEVKRRNRVVGWTNRDASVLHGVKMKKDQAYTIFASMTGCLHSCPYACQKCTALFHKSCVFSAKASEQLECSQTFYRVSANDILGHGEVHWVNQLLLRYLWYIVKNSKVIYNCGSLLKL